MKGTRICLPQAPIARVSISLLPLLVPIVINDCFPPEAYSFTIRLIIKNYQQKTNFEPKELHIINSDYISTTKFQQTRWIDRQLTLYHFDKFLLILLLVQMEHAKHLTYPYYTSVVPQESPTLHQLKEYNQMVERLNRQNEQLNRNVVELIKENTRLKTEMNYRCISGADIRNRSQQQRTELISQTRTISPNAQTMQRIQFPFSKTIQNTALSGKATHSPPKITFGTSNKSEQASKVLSFHSPSPTFIDQLSEERFQNRQQIESEILSNSLNKSKKEAEMVKQMKQYPYRENSTSFSQIQVQGTANPKNNQQMEARIAQYHRQPVDPKILLQQLKEGIRQVRSKLNLKDNQRSKSSLVQKQLASKTSGKTPRKCDNIEEEQPRSKAPQLKKSNAPYMLNYSYNEVCPPREFYERRNNLDYLQRKPKYSYTPFTTRDVLIRHYY